MDQQEQNFLREKQKILKLMPDSVAFSREEAKLLEIITEELLEYRKICSLSELKMLCEDAERYSALNDAFFSEGRSEKNYLKQEILDTLASIAKRYKTKNEELKDIPTKEKDTSFCTAKESDFNFQIKQKVFYVYRGWKGGYFYCPAFILGRKEAIEQSYKDERHWRLDINNTLSNTRQYNSYEIFAMYDTKSDKVNVSEEELCATEKEAIARITELNKEKQECLELD